MKITQGTLVCALAIVLIFILELVLISHGINGIVATSAIGSICAIAGFAKGRFTKKSGYSAQSFGISGTVIPGTPSLTNSRSWGESSRKTRLSTPIFNSAARERMFPALSSQLILQAAKNFFRRAMWGWCSITSKARASSFLLAMARMTPW